MELIDYGARWYDPYLNRFVSPDSIVPGVENPQAWNRYAYTLNNPLKYVDPSGHQGCEGNESEYQQDASIVEDVIAGVQNSAGDIVRDAIGLKLIRSGFPSTFGIKGDIALGGDLIFGVDFSAEHTVAWNWYSGELGLIEGAGEGYSVGTPQGVGLNVSVGFMAGHGATGLDSFAGSSHVVYGSLQSDEFVKFGGNGSLAIGLNEQGAPYRDDLSGSFVHSEYVGINAGVNAVANIFDARVGTSTGVPPAANSSRVINSAEDLGDFFDDAKSFTKDFASDLIPWR